MNDNIDIEVDDEARQIAAQYLSSRFRHFARNGRWGTCGKCPIDSALEHVPELCVHFKEPDHRRTGEELVAEFNELVALHRGQLSVAKGLK